MDLLRLSWVFISCIKLIFMCVSWRNVVEFGAQDSLLGNSNTVVGVVYCIIFLCRNAESGRTSSSLSKCLLHFIYCYISLKDSLCVMHRGFLTLSAALCRPYSSNSKCWLQGRCVYTPAVLEAFIHYWCGTMLKRVTEWHVNVIHKAVCRLEDRGLCRLYKNTVWCCRRRNKMSLSGTLKTRLYLIKAWKASWVWKQTQFQGKKLKHLQ